MYWPTHNTSRQKGRHSADRSLGKQDTTATNWGAGHHSHKGGRDRILKSWGGGQHSHGEGQDATATKQEGQDRQKGLCFFLILAPPAPATGLLAFPPGEWSHSFLKSAEDAA